MNFSVTKSKLLKILQEVVNVVPTKTTLPVLSNILLEATESQLKLAATDLDIFIISRLGANVAKTGSITFLGKTFIDIIRELPETEIEFEVKENRVEIRADTGVYKISGIPAEEFPKLPEASKAKEIKLPGVDLVRMIKKTSFAVSADETRPALNGILWQTSGEKMYMVATDGHRLAKISKENTKLKGLHEDIIIPRKVLDILTKLFGDEKNDIGVIFGENGVIFSFGQTVLSSRLIDGPYPNYEQVIPKDNDKRLIVDKNQLQASIRRVSILSNSLTHQVKFALRKNSLELTAANFDVGGEAKEILKCSYKNENMELGYNANYVLDILRQIDGDEAVFDLATPVSAGTVYSPSPPAGEDYFCLIMPLRLAE